MLAKVRARAHTHTERERERDPRTVGECRSVVTAGSAPSTADDVSGSRCSSRDCVPRGLISLYQHEWEMGECRHTPACHRC